MLYFTLKGSYISAAYCGHLEICKFLIQHGADVHAENKNGDTPQSMNNENSDISDLFEYW